VQHNKLYKIEPSYIAIMVSETPTLDQKIAMSEMATEIRKQMASVEAQFNRPARRAKMIEDILKGAKVSGEAMKPEYAAAAVEDWFDTLNQYEPNPPGFWHTFWNLYINRVQIFKTIACGAAGIATLAAIGIGAHGFVTYRAERGAEQAIAESHAQFQRLQNQSDSLQASSSQYHLEGNPEISAILSSSRNRITGLSEFFAIWCPNGDSTEAVTRQNYGEVGQQLIGIDDALGQIASSLDTGRQRVAVFQESNQIQDSLERLITGIREESPPQQLLTRSEAAYQTGILAAQNLNVGEARSAQQQLNDLAQGVRDFRVLPDQAEQRYQSILQIVQEPAARTQADAIYATAQQAFGTADIPTLRQSVQNLDALSAILNQEYQVVIVNRQGLRSGIDRYYTDQNGRRSAGYYLIVEARDAQGNVIPQYIRSQETNQTEQVTMWGEQVPEEVYQRVGGDKQDDGLINGRANANGVVGVKHRGFLSFDMTFTDNSNQPLQRTGQITHW